MHEPEQVSLSVWTVVSPESSEIEIEYIAEKVTPEQEIVTDETNETIATATTCTLAPKVPEKKVVNEPATKTALKRSTPKLP